MLGFVACTDTSEELFDPDMKIAPLGPVATSGVGGTSGISLSDPPPVATGGSSNDTTQDPVNANAGSGGTSTVLPPRPPRSDAGAVAGDGADAGAVPPIPATGDDSCGDQCEHTSARSLGRGESRRR